MVGDVKKPGEAKAFTQLTRVGPTMRGEVLQEDQAKAQIDDLCKGADWEEVKTPF
jgi:hypothetical protein